MFASNTAVDYAVCYVTEGFLLGEPVILNPDYDYTSGKGQPIMPDQAASLRSNLSQYEVLKPQRCRQAYSKDFVNDRRTLVVVTDINTSTTANNGYASNSSFYDWARPNLFFDPHEGAVYAR